jgi:hypothetical protein
VQHVQVNQGGQAIVVPPTSARGREGGRAHLDVSWAAGTPATYDGDEAPLPDSTH